MQPCRKDTDIHIVVSEIIGPCYPETANARRKRMRPILDDVMKQRGWAHQGANRYYRPTG
jgi:hypothetical protein